MTIFQTLLIVVFSLSIIGFIYSFYLEKRLNKKIQGDKTEVREKKEKMFRNKRITLITSFSLLGISILGGVIFLFLSNAKSTVTDNAGNKQTMPEGITKLRTDGKISDLITTEKTTGASQHFALGSKELNYKSPTPTSGPHAPNVQTWGFYKNQIALGLIVHNMEHGDVIIHYNPKLRDNEISYLKKLSQYKIVSNIGAGAGVVVVPNSKINDDVVVTSWGKKMELKKFDEVKIETFISQNILKGPEFVPPMR